MEHLKYVAIANKYPDVGVIDEDGNAFHAKTKEKIKLDDSVVDQEFQRLKSEEQATQYQRDRKYPILGEQLDMIYWDRKNGTKKWEETIDKIKKDFPKPDK